MSETKPTIPLIDSASSSIAAHGYDLESKTMAIKFRNGATYHYPEVKPDEYSDFVNSDSLGRHHAMYFRKRKAVKQ